MDAKQEEIIRKVQKLFRLAEKAGSDAEAQAAALRAREILGKYNLSLQDVEGFTDEECSEHSVVIKKDYIPSYVKLLMRAINTLFQCHCIVASEYGESFSQRKRITFIGVGPDAILACQTYDYLSWFGKKQAKKRGYTARQTSEYLYWFSASVSARASEMMNNLHAVPQENSLVPLKDSAISDYERRHYGDLREMAPVKKRRLGRFGQQGITDGRNVSLDRPVESSAAQLSLS